MIGLLLFENKLMGILNFHILISNIAKRNRYNRHKKEKNLSGTWKIFKTTKKVL